MVGWNQGPGRIVKVIRLESIQSLLDDHLFGNLRDTRMAGRVIEYRKERLLFVGAVPPVRLGILAGTGNAGILAGTGNARVAALYVLSFSVSCRFPSCRFPSCRFVVLSFRCRFRWLD
jgi:hypothetical protein